MTRRHKLPTNLYLEVKCCIKTLLFCLSRICIFDKRNTELKCSLSVQLVMDRTTSLANQNNKPLYCRHLGPLKFGTWSFWNYCTTKVEVGVVFEDKHVFCKQNVSVTKIDLAPEHGTHPNTTSSTYDRSLNKEFCGEYSHKGPLSSVIQSSTALLSKRAVQYLHFARFLVFENVYTVVQFTCWTKFRAFLSRFFCLFRI